MSQGRGHEPLFVHSRWGMGFRVFNHRNPIGLALLIVVPTIATLGLILMSGGS
ncbi:hypothetical protein OG216_17675 [Streptomycetaceae bacterium NBC_01309]